jgi:methyl acetate hydrolase
VFDRSPELCAAVLLVALTLALPPPAPDRQAPLHTFIHDSAPRDVPAIAALVVDRDKVLFDDVSGWRDAAARAPLQPDSIFRIASMTKPITSLAIMMLHEQGKVGFDDPVTKYLPQFDRLRVMTEFHDDGSYESRLPNRPVLVRHLLTHTSGIGYAFADPRLAKISGGARKEIVDLPLLHDPGEKFTYGPNTYVLGQIVEKASGETLDVFLRENIFEPLGMRDTSYVVPADQRSRVVTFHTRQNGAWTERPNPDTIRSDVAGDGGLFSTTHDYGAFLQMILNRGRRGTTPLASEDSIRLMTTNQMGEMIIQQQPSADPALAMPFPIGAGKDKFGFGFQVEMPPATKGLRHAGSVSWGGIYNTHFWIDPHAQIGAVLLMQVLPYYDEAAVKVLKGFESRVYGIW